MCECVRAFVCEKERDRARVCACVCVLRVVVATNNAQKNVLNFFHWMYHHQLFISSSYTHELMHRLQICGSVEELGSRFYYYLLLLFIRYITDYRLQITSRRPFPALCVRVCVVYL